MVETPNVLIEQGREDGLINVGHRLNCLSQSTVKLMDLALKDIFSARLFLLLKDISAIFVVVNLKSYLMTSREEHRALFGSPKENQ